MINVRIDVEGMRLEVKGHAGYAPAGHDIICAAVSTLAYTLAQNLALTLCMDEYSAQFEDGYAYIEANPPETSAEQCRGIFMTIANGFAMLAAQYGQYIQFEGE